MGIAMVLGLISRHIHFGPQGCDAEIHRISALFSIHFGIQPTHTIRRLLLEVLDFRDSFSMALKSKLARSWSCWFSSTALYMNLGSHQG